MPNILIVEDEEALCQMLKYNLEAEGYFVEICFTGEDAEKKMEIWLPDLILLDCMLPGLSGIEFCRKLRNSSSFENIPIIMITALGEESQKIRGLETGADDYIVKPFSTPELIARINSRLRNLRLDKLAFQIRVGDIVLDRKVCRVWRAGREIQLGPTEFKLLEFFMQTKGSVFTRKELLNAVWGYEIHVDERTVDVHIRRLRKSLNKGKEKDPIRTVRGTGYSFDEQFAP